MSTPTALEFELNAPRSESTLRYRDGQISGVRRGKPNGKGIVEDNGIAMRFSSNMTPEIAESILYKIYNETRKMDGSSWGEQAGATAASAILTDKGVTIRGAGDSVVMAIGENGKVMLLNELHAGEGQIVTNSLMPGHDSAHLDSKGFFSWKELESRLGGNIRIVTASDGIYGQLRPNQVEAHVEHLISSGKLDINSPDFSGKLYDKAKVDPIFAGKKDDIVILSAKKPPNGETVLLHALDGIGSGYRESAVIASMSVASAKEILDPYSRAVRITSNGNELPQQPRKQSPQLSPAELELGTAVSNFVSRDKLNYSETNKGEKVVILRGSPEELQSMHTLLKKQGIESVIEPKESSFGAGVRIRTASMPKFDEIIGRYIAHQDFADNNRQAEQKAMVKPVPLKSNPQLLHDEMALGKNLSGFVSRDKIDYVHTNNGNSAVFRGNQSELQNLQKQFQKLGIQTSMTTTDGQFGEGLRIRSSDMPKFNAIMDGYIEHQQSVANNKQPAQQTPSQQQQSRHVPTEAERVLQQQQMAEAKKASVIHKNHSETIADNKTGVGNAGKVAGATGVGLGIYGLSEKLGENGTYNKDVKNHKNLANTGVAADVGAIGSGAVSVIKNFKSAGPVGAALGVVSGGIETTIAIKDKDGHRAATAIGGTTGGLAGGIAGGVLGTKLGAVAGASIGVWLGGVGAVPAAAIGSVVGGLVFGTAGALGFAWAGGKTGDAVAGDAMHKYLNGDTQSTQKSSVPVTTIAKADVAAITESLKTKNVSFSPYGNGYTTQTTGIGVQKTSPSQTH